MDENEFKLLNDYSTLNSINKINFNIFDSLTFNHFQNFIKSYLISNPSLCQYKPDSQFKFKFFKKLISTLESFISDNDDSDLVMLLSFTCRHNDNVNLRALGNR